MEGMMQAQLQQPQRQQQQSVERLNLEAVKTRAISLFKAILSHPRRFRRLRSFKHHPQMVHLFCPNFFHSSPPPHINGGLF
ncbi:hypothetical protein O6P43_026589, partial [Quillaja saponaria]